MSKKDAYALFQFAAFSSASVIEGQVEHLFVETLGHSQKTSTRIFAVFIFENADCNYPEWVK